MNGLRALWKAEYNREQGIKAIKKAFKRNASLTMVGPSLRELMLALEILSDVKVCVRRFGNSDANPHCFQKNINNMAAAGVFALCMKLLFLFRFCASNKDAKRECFPAFSSFVPFSFRDGY